MSQYKDIDAFHKKFKFDQGKGIKSMNYNFGNWRVDFLMEEIAELTDALDNKDDVYHSRKHGKKYNDLIWKRLDKLVIDLNLT